MYELITVVINFITQFVLVFSLLAGIAFFALYLFAKFKGRESAKRYKKNIFISGVTAIASIVLLAGFVLVPSFFQGCNTLDCGSNSGIYEPATQVSIQPATEEKPPLVLQNPFEENMPRLDSYLSSASSSHAYEKEFPDVVKMTISRCGPTIQFLGLLMEAGKNQYAFSRGTCSPGLAKNIIIVPYFPSSDTIGEIIDHDMYYSSFGYDFGHEYTRPISMQKWKLSSSEMLKICAQYNGASRIDQPNSVGLLLRQTNDRLIWKCIHSDNTGTSVIQTDGTTGEHINSETWGLMPI